jgi:hypothetical protein
MSIVLVTDGFINIGNKFTAEYVTIGGGDGNDTATTKGPPVSTASQDPTNTDVTTQMPPPTCGGKWYD